MAPTDSHANGEAFLVTMAAERDEMLTRFNSVTAERTVVLDRLKAVGERYRVLLGAFLAGRPDLQERVSMPSDILALLDEGTREDVPTVFELALDSMLADLHRCQHEETELRTQLAELAGQSEAWAQRVRHHEANEDQLAKHAREKESLQEFVAGVVSKARPASSESIPPASVSVETIRQLQALDVEGGKKTISEFFTMYCEAHRSEWKDWANRVKRDCTPVRDALIEVANCDLPIEQLSVQHARRFMDHVRNQTSEKRGRSGTTLKKVNFLKAALNWGKQQTLLPDLSGPLVMDAEYESYEAFEPAELVAIFESAAYVRNSFGRASRFWLPMLGLYTGGRIDELASIKVDQFDEKEGFFGVLLSPGGKSTGKNKFSRRFVPMHPALVDCGLKGYIDTLKREGYADLFPCLPSAVRDGKGKAASRDFQAYRRSIDIGASKGEGRGTKVFHSFRSTIVTAMQKAGVPQEVREAIAGHARSGVHARIYSQGELPVSQRMDAVASVNFGLRHPVWTDTEAYRYARKNQRTRTGRD